MIAIIGAQDEEIVGIKHLMKDQKEIDFFGYQCFLGNINQKAVLLAKSKVGSVACSVLMSLLFSHYPITFAFNVGTAGSYKKANITPFTFVVGEKLSYYDADLTFFKHYQYGQMAACPRFFESSTAMVAKIKQERWSFPLVYGTIVSGEKFVTSKQDVLAIIKQEFKDDHVVAMDMESTYFAQVCYLFQKPFLVLRIISDIVDDGNQAQSYASILQKSSEAYQEFLRKLI